MPSSYSARSSSPLKPKSSSQRASASSSGPASSLSLVEQFRLKARQKLEQEEANGGLHAARNARAALDSDDDDDSDDGLPGELNLSRMMAGVKRGNTNAEAGPSQPTRSRSHSMASNASSIASVEYGPIVSAPLPSSTPANRARRSVAKTDKYSFRPKMVKPREETMLRLEAKKSAAVQVGLRSREEMAAAKSRSLRSSSPSKQQELGAEPEFGQAWDTSALIRARKRERRLGLDPEGMTELDRIIEMSRQAFEEGDESSEHEGSERDDAASSPRRRRLHGGSPAMPRRPTPWEDSEDDELSESDSESEVEGEAGDSSMATIKPEMASPSKAVKHAHFDLPDDDDEEMGGVGVAGASSEDSALQAVEKAILASTADRPSPSPTKRKGKRARNAEEDDNGADDADRLMRILKKDRKDLRAAQRRGAKDKSLVWRRGRFPIYQTSSPALSSDHPIQALLLRTMAAGGEIGLYPASLSDAPRFASHLSSGLLALYDFQNGSEDGEDLEAAVEEVVSLAQWLFELAAHAKSRQLGQAAATGLHHLLQSPCAAREVERDGISTTLRSHLADEILSSALPEALHRLGAKPVLLDVAYGHARPTLAPIARIHRHGLGAPPPGRLESRARAHCVERILSMVESLAPHNSVESARKASVAVAWLAADPSVHHLSGASETALHALTERALSHRPATELNDLGLQLDKLDGATQAARVVRALPSLTLRQRIVRSCAASLALLGPAALSSAQEEHDTRSLVPLRKLLDALDSRKASVNPLHVSMDMPGDEERGENGRGARESGGTDYVVLEARVELFAIAMADVPLQLCTWEQLQVGDAQEASEAPGLGHAAPTDANEGGTSDSRKAPQRRTGLGGLAARPAVRQALAELEGELKQGGGSNPRLRFSAARLGMLEKLVEKIQDVNGRVNERGGSKLERTRVKDRLMRLALTVHYLVEAIVGSENVGGQVGKRGAPKLSGGNAMTGKKGGRQSTLFESFASAKVKGG